MSEEALIRELLRRFSDAVKRRDPSAIMECYVHSESLHIFDAAPPIQIDGWTSYKSIWSSTFSEFPGPASVCITELQLAVGTNLAYAHSIQVGSLTRRDGTVRSATFRVTDVFQKADGKWLIAHEHVSVPADPESGRACF